VADDPRLRQLIENLWADPDADEPRALYADWLTKQGDPRGEFIALGLKEAADASLQKQLKALVKTHGKEWISPVRPYVRAWTWRRGFLHTVTCDTARFIEGAQALVAQSPDLVLTLTGVKPAQLDELARLPLGRLYGLNLREQRLDDVQAATLFASPTLEGLRTLDLSYLRFGAGGAEALAGSPVRTTLKTLTLERTPIGDRGLEALMASPGFPELRQLGLKDCGLTTASAIAIARSRAFPKLEQLQLDYNSLGDEGAKAMAADLTGFPALKKLAIVTSGLTSAGALALAESKTLAASLDTLEINFEGWVLPVSTPAGHAVMSRFPKSVP
jgi:uncharacterized protein (TIGR02996 family)